jgi:hypothetical protein
MLSNLQQRTVEGRRPMTSLVPIGRHRRACRWLWTRRVGVEMPYRREMSQGVKTMMGVRLAVIHSLYTAFARIVSNLAFKKTYKATYPQATHG